MTVNNATRQELVRPLAVWFELKAGQRQQIISLLVKLAMASLLAQREPNREELSDGNQPAGC